MPLLVGLVVLGHHKIAILVDWKLRLVLVQLHKGVVSICVAADGVALQITDVFEH